MLQLLIIVIISALCGGVLCYCNGKPVFQTTGGRIYEWVFPRRQTRQAMPDSKTTFPKSKEVCVDRHTDEYSFKNNKNVCPKNEAYKNQALFSRFSSSDKAFLIMPARIGFFT